MKCLTICQPYADLICLPDEDPRAKRVENRKWSTPYRGPLLIHAGLSRNFLGGDNYGIDERDMVFGSILGVVDLVDCFHLKAMAIPDLMLAKYPWLDRHIHVDGPICWVLEGVRRFRQPVACRGERDLFEVVINDALEAELEAAALCFG